MVMRMNHDTREQLKEAIEQLKEATHSIEDSASVYFVKCVAHHLNEVYFIDYMDAIRIASSIKVVLNFSIESDEDRKVFDELAMVYANVIVKLTESVFDNQQRDFEVMKNFALQTHVKF
jgi:uncharacterized damage-inducible protein DinB